MTRLQWDAPEERSFEGGVSQGVIFTKDGNAFPWNGLVRVEQSKHAGDVTKYYIDGFNHYTGVTNEGFDGTIEAFTYPDILSQLTGSAYLQKGLIFDNQRPKPFNLVYKTYKWSGENGLIESYKLHILYNVIATVDDRTYKTIDGSSDADTFSWSIMAMPTSVPGYMPISHISIDSLLAKPFLMSAVEDILYGTDDRDPMLPSLTDLKELFDTWVTLTVTDNGDGTFTVSGPDEIVYMTSDTEFTIDWDSAFYINDDTYTVTDY